MVVNEGVFVDGTEDITTRDMVSDLELSRVEVPRNSSIKSLRVDTAYKVSPVVEPWQNGVRGM